MDPEKISGKKDLFCGEGSRQEIKCQKASRLLICEYCGKSFINKTRLSRHELVHVQKVRYSCSYCPKQFYWQCDMKKHTYIHTGEGSSQEVIQQETCKPFTCQQCGKSFENSSSLSQHEQFHLKVKKNPCSYCEMNFHRKDDLMKHTSIHTGEAPFRCNVCGKILKSSSCLKSHSKLHVGKKHYPCRLCNWRFLNLKEVFRHVASEHWVELKNSDDPESLIYPDAIYPVSM